MNFHNIIFKRNDGLGGFRSRTHFTNGLSLSVSAGSGIYSNPREDRSSINQFLTFEIAVFDADDNFITKTFFPDGHDDVVGWLSRVEINDLMNRIANHSKPQKDIPGFEGTLDQLSKLKI